mmetsp:Transcript_28895/g.54189  ORF Transcript_28895/g.54189 Transcript_28895/m.54189 type:complete len:569 (-) Transcript_28895:84-1790(-)
MQLSEYVLPFATYFAEFLGTFFVAFTSSLLLTRDESFVGSWAWRASGMAFATIASIAATSAVSGSHLNPAVSLAFGLSRKMYWGRVWTYIVLQTLAALLACGTVSLIMEEELPAVKPKSYYDFLDAGLVEGIYSAMYSFVALNCVASLENNPRGFRNQFFPVAIGLVLIAGGPPCSEVSGGVVNPAITLGFFVFGQGRHAAHSLLLVLAQAVGALGAAVLFFLVRPEELAAVGVRVGEGLSCNRICSAFAALNFCSRRKSQTDEESNSDEEVENHASQKYRPPLAARIISELVGTYLVVITFGLCAVATNRAQAESSHGQAAMQTMAVKPNASATGPSPVQDAKVVLSTPYSTGAAVLTLTYALASVSGAHFNPAVTLAVMFSSRDPYVWAEGPTLILAQATGAVAAAVTYLFISRGQAKVVPAHLPHLGPGTDFTWFAVNLSEMLFTLAIAYVVLCVTTIKSPRYPKATSVVNFDFGIAIGFTYMAGGWVTQWVSGGMLNPAVSLGVAAADLLHDGTESLETATITKTANDLLVQYVVWQCAGGVLAAFLFWLFHPLLYKQDPLLVK